MSEIKAGVVLVSRFISPHSKKFAGYVDYIARDEAVRNNNFDKFSAYQDYMDNPNKTTELFTANHDNLTPEQKQELKKRFELAQKNGSLMWQNVISFDNRWLEEHGIYISKTQTLNEKKLKEITRLAMGQMLESENMKSSAIWSASIHYNTDNIHIHIAAVEPNPTRETIMFNGKEQYRGKLKPKTIERMKSRIVNNILERSEKQNEINRLIRERIIGSKKKTMSYHDNNLRHAFKELYKKLPPDKRMWQYNMNGFSHLRGELDELSRMYMETYHTNEFADLKKRLYEEQDELKKAYGGDGRKLYENYAENKINDLYTRLGNTILKEMKEYDRIQKPLFSNMSKRQKSKYNLQNNTSVGSCLRRLRQNMKRNIESTKNQRHHEQLFQQIEQEMDR